MLMFIVEGERISYDVWKYFGKWWSGKDRDFKEIMFGFRLFLIC